MNQTNTEPVKTLRERLAEKVLKLMSLASSPNEAEAMEAMAMAQRLILTHSITEAELEAKKSQSTPQTVTATVLETMKQKVGWKGSLAYAIAELNGAQMYWSHDEQRQRIIRLLGTEGAIANTVTTYNYLIATTLRLATEGVAREKDLYKLYLGAIKGLETEPIAPPKWSSWKEKFIQGCAHRLQHRVSLLKRELEQEGIPTVQTTDAETNALMLPVTALAVRENYALARQSIALYRRANGIQLTTGRASSYKVTSAYTAGAKAGGSVSLNRQMGGGGNRPALNS